MYSPQRRGRIRREHAGEAPTRRQREDIRSQRTRPVKQRPQREYATPWSDSRLPTAAFRRQEGDTLRAAQTTLIAERRIDGPRPGETTRGQSTARVARPAHRMVERRAEQRAVADRGPLYSPRIRAYSPAVVLPVRKEYGKNTGEDERIQQNTREYATNRGRAHYPTATGWRAYARILRTRAAD